MAVSMKDIDERLTFGTFVEGEGSGFACAMARTFASGRFGKDNYLGAVPNPLCLYGGPGLGKTHLLHAIGNSAVARNPMMTVAYVTAGDFADEFSRIGTGAVMDDIPGGDFVDYYHQLDVLLVDDLQLLSGRHEASRMLCHVFETMLRAGKRVAVASSVDVSDLRDVSIRLLAVLESGMTVQVTPPDGDGLVRIVRSIADRDGITLPTGMTDLIKSAADNQRPGSRRDGRGLTAGGRPRFGWRQDGELRWEELPARR